MGLPPPDLLKSEEALRAALSSIERSWSAMGLPAHFQQALSFEIVNWAALFLRGLATNTWYFAHPELAMRSVLVSAASHQVRLCGLHRTVVFFYHAC